MKGEEEEAGKANKRKEEETRKGKIEERYCAKAPSLQFAQVVSCLELHIFLNYEIFQEADFLKFILEILLICGHNFRGKEI